MDNPHTRKQSSCPCTIDKIAALPFAARTAKLFEHVRGQPISNKSKTMFSVLFSKDKRFHLADVRVLSPSLSKDNLVNLEFFFDGEITDLHGDETGFIEAVTCQITSLYLDSLRVALSQAIHSHNAQFISEFKDISTKISAFTPNTIRDAGCMLRFVAVRLAIEPRIAAFIGREVFPEDFDGQVDEDDKTGSLPFWFNAVIVACVAAFFAVVFAWGQIIKKALEQHSQ